MIDKLPETAYEEEWNAKLNEIIDVLNSMCDKWDYTPKPEGQMIGGVPQVFPCERIDPETESQEHMKKSMPCMDVKCEPLCPVCSNGLSHCTCGKSVTMEDVLIEELKEEK